MGIQTGEVVRQLDVNGNMNVSGDGINLAQRVMDFGDAGHILMSLAYATELQRAGDPAAADCHEIGVASANTECRSIFIIITGPPSVPRMCLLVCASTTIGSDHANYASAPQARAFVATLQILGWLLTRPLQWRTHVTQIDPRLSTNFSIIDLTGPQIRRNRDVRALLLQVYVVCPALLSLLVLAVLLPFPRGQGISAVGAVSTLIGMGYLVSILLGIGAAFVGVRHTRFSSDRGRTCSSHFWAILVRQRHYSRGRLRVRIR